MASCFWLTGSRVCSVWDSQWLRQWYTRCRWTVRLPHVLGLYSAAKHYPRVLGPGWFGDLETNRRTCRMAGHLNSCKHDTCQKLLTCKSVVKDGNGVLDFEETVILMHVYRWSLALLSLPAEGSRSGLLDNFCCVSSISLRSSCPFRSVRTMHTNSQYHWMYHFRVCSLFSKAFWRLHHPGASRADIRLHWSTTTGHANREGHRREVQGSVWWEHFSPQCRTQCFSIEVIPVDFERKNNTERNKEKKNGLALAGCGLGLEVQESSRRSALFLAASVLWARDPDETPAALSGHKRP